MKALNYSQIIILTLFVLLSGCGRHDDLPQKGVNYKNVNNKVSVSVILETSASMQGYLNGDQFKADVTNFIAELDKMTKKSDFGIEIDSLNYLTTFIKNEKPEFHYITNDSYDFNTKILNGKIATGTTSPLDDIVNKLVREHSPSKISILISDFVVDIKSPAIIPTIQSRFNTIFNKVSEKDLAVSIYRLTTDFSGIYYPSFGKSFPVSGKIVRPYFIWILGDKNDLIKFRRRMENSQVFKPLQEAHIGFGVVPVDPDILYYSNNPQGRFRFKDGEFTNIKLDNGCLKITLGIDLNSIPLYAQQVSYLNENKYASSSSCNINYFNIIPQSTFGRRLNPKDKSHSHYIEVLISQLHLENNTVHLRLKKVPIDWSSLSTHDDSNLNFGNNLKTFLLEEIIAGIQNAYGELNPENSYFNYDLIINK